MFNKGTGTSVCLFSWKHGDRVALKTALKADSKVVRPEGKARGEIKRTNSSRPGHTANGVLIFFAFGFLPWLFPGFLYLLGWEWEREAWESHTEE